MFMWMASFLSLVCAPPPGVKPRAAGSQSRGYVCTLFGDCASRTVLVDPLD